MAKVFQLQLQHQSFQYSGPISFRMDQLYLLAVQGTLKSLLQHNSKASILRYSAFFIAQLSRPYMTTGKAIALTKQIFVGKVMFLPFNMLSRFVIAFLPRSPCLLICDCYCFHFFKIEFYFILKFVHSLYSNNRITQFSQHCNYCRMPRVGL